MKVKSEYMIIKTLIENTSVSDKYKNEHGLSLYIETKKHKILFDTGASDLFLENAKKMNVDIADVDIAIISHGHYDHAGGIKAFFKANSKARVYINQGAFNKHYSLRQNEDIAYIGLDETLLPNDRFIFAQDNLIIDDELELFSNVKGTRLSPTGNQALLMQDRDLIVLDDFAHEQNLIIKEDDKTLLVAGCAHKGIVNILEHYIGIMNGILGHVIGGFHLYNHASKTNENPQIVMQIGEYLKSIGLNFYTCHCTGIESYNQLKEILGEKIQYLATGSQLII